jgi:hypothetical protein
VSDDWGYYQGRIEALARRVGSAEAGLRLIRDMVFDRAQTGYILREIDRILLLVAAPSPPSEENDLRTSFLNKGMEP